MVELVRSNDLVEISWLQALLRDAGIESLVFDLHASAIEGGITAIPRRLVVHADDAERARAVLAAAQPPD
jgi:hypothetical protein